MKGIKILTDVIYYLLLMQMFFSVLLLHFVGSLPCKYEQTPNLNEKKTSALTSTVKGFLKKNNILTFCIPILFTARVFFFFFFN